jgi:ferrochelatase
VRIGVVLFNLGGPDSLDAVEPFLRNLFSDPAIISLSAPLRLPLAWLIAKRRGPLARDIYAKIGGRSPLVEETQKQARALESALSAQGHEARAVIAMRAWKPFAPQAAAELQAWKPERIVLLPLYPQFSTTTTASSLEDWAKAARASCPTTVTSRVCCYPWDEGFIAAESELVQQAWARRKLGVDYRLLLSAHGLPKRMISRGDPYQWQVEKTAEAIVEKLGMAGLDWSLCYQSRVGPLEWIGPATDAEVHRAGRDGKGIVIAPIAFVSEHSETLVELEIEYAHLAKRTGVRDYIRVPTVGTHPAFVDGLARLVMRAVENEPVVTCASGRICPKQWRACGYDAAYG